MNYLNSSGRSDHENDLTVPAMLAMLEKIEAEASSDLIMEPVAKVVREAISMLMDLRQVAYEAMLEADSDWIALGNGTNSDRHKLC